jgi:hypothetical protein
MSGMAQRDERFSHMSAIVGSVRDSNAEDRGHVLIEHLSVTGHDERIERPVTEAVAWRFMIEKFGGAPSGS